MLLQKFPQENGAFGYRQHLRAEVQHRFVELLAGFPSFQEPPESLADCEKITVASLSVTFHSVRWARSGRRCLGQPITHWNLAVFGQSASGTPTSVLKPRAE